MTREEAIELLCAYGVPQDEKRFQEAIDMAIEALSADAYAEAGAVNIEEITPEEFDTIA